MVSAAPPPTSVATDARTAVSRRRRFRFYVHCIIHPLFFRAYYSYINPTRILVY
jgi:hypothetical protein